MNDELEQANKERRNSITAKQLAQILGISEAAVSMALNGKPGVSKERRAEIIEAAKEYGYDFSRINDHYKGGNILFYLFSKYRTIIDNTEFFNAVIKSVERACKNEQVYLTIEYVSDINFLVKLLKEASKKMMTGVLLLGTEMSEAELSEIQSISVPIIVMDCVYDTLPFNYVCINNRQGAYIATQFLLKQYHTQPGYLKSDFNIVNFRERADGFYNAIRSVGLSPSRSIIHRLSPSIEGAYSDMKQILENGEKPVRCYFADNDLIAIGAMRALKEFGYRIPRDVAIIGFDNIAMSAKSEISLSSIDVPKDWIGPIAVSRLLIVMKNTQSYTANTLINGVLICRRTTDL